MHNFDDYLIARGQLEHAKEPDDPLNNPYTFYHGQDGTSLWTIMAQYPEGISTFQKGLACIDVAVPVVGHFNFSSLKNTAEEDAEGIVELVDVGGGHGAILKKILDAHPQLSPRNVVLQELPDIIDMARTNGILPSETRLLEHDYNTEQPIKRAKAYFMRMILHDHRDDVNIHILKQLSAAMSANSRVFVCEMVLPALVTEADFPAAGPGGDGHGRQGAYRRWLPKSVSYCWA